MLDLLTGSRAGPVVDDWRGVGVSRVGWWSQHQAVSRDQVENGLGFGMSMVQRYFP